jgi:hypothetical protein
LRPEVFEEFQHRLVFKRGRIGEVDHHLRAGHGLFDALAGDRVDAAIGRGGDDLVGALGRMATVFDPIRPVPPMTTIFMVCLPVDDSQKL